MRTGKSLLVADIQTDPRAKSRSAVPDQHAAIGVPLRSEGHMYGALWLLHRTPGFFGEKHLRQVEVLASHVAAALSRAQAFDEARRLSITDELTGCYNRRYFMARLREECSRAQRYGHELTLVMVDSDALKEVNDQFGHEAGNRHLIELARTIKAHIRATDLIARYGGDEFVVLQPEADLDAGQATAERIREAAAKRMGDIATSVSIGVAAYPVNAKDADGLFRAADRALLDAKALGKNTVVVAKA
jgi:diguanylate cyclase (GGDEF)-like protein